jgi:hypothetical protein
MTQKTDRDRSEKALADLKHQYLCVDAATEGVLTKKAQAGDVPATTRLFHSVSSLGVKKAAGFRSRDTTAENLGEMYLTFLGAVKTYAPGKGCRFTTWFGCKAGYGTQETIRQRGKRMEREKGEVLKECRPYRDSDTGEIGEKVIPTEAHPWFDMEEEEEESALAFVPAGVNLEAVLAVFPEASRERVALRAMAGIGREKAASQADLAREWNCSRQNVSQFIGGMFSKVVAELG